MCHALLQDPRFFTLLLTIDLQQAVLTRREGGFALSHGEPGSGKSVALRVLAQRLARLARCPARRHQPSAEQLGRLLPRAWRRLRRAAAPAQPLGRLQGAARALARPSGVVSAPPGPAHRRVAGGERARALRAAPDGQRAVRLPAPAVRGAGRRRPLARQAAARGTHPAGQPHPHPSDH